MSFLATCKESISGKGVATLYWHHVGKLHVIPNVIISDRDSYFIGNFWKELWQFLGADLRMDFRYYPESSGQVG